MKCSQNAGFLIPRPCRSEATVQCSVCGGWVCGEHTASLPTGGLACTGCAAERNVGPGAAQRQVRQTYGYHDTWYGGAWGAAGGFRVHGYQHSDYDAFERRGEGEPEAGEELERLDGS